MGQTILPLRLVHGRFRVLGFRLGDLAYCTDVNHIPESTWPLLEGLDTLILDALRHRPHSTHFSVAEAVAVSQRLGAERTYFTHICHDLGHAQTNAQLPRGHGLENTRERLRALYGENASLAVDRRPEGGTIATLKLPYREMAPESNGDTV